VQSLLVSFSIHVHMFYGINKQKPTKNCTSVTIYYLDMKSGTLGRPSEL